MTNNFQNFQLQNQQNPNQNAQQSQISNMMMPNYQQNTILFPQPIGSVYNLNTAADIANVPTGAGVSLGLCLNENILYIKALQNGAPALLSYRLGPIETNEISEDSKDNERIKQILQSFEARFAAIEKELSGIKDKVGGKKIEWQI